MKPFLQLAQARTPEGAELTLHAHDAHFYLRVNRQPLMGTNASESEKVLAQLACDRLRDKTAARVLIGGLGFGFTLRRVLELVGADAQVQVAERQAREVVEPTLVLT
jgi:spermidine synthase